MKLCRIALCLLAFFFGFSAFHAEAQTPTPAPAQPTQVADARVPTMSYYILNHKKPVPIGTRVLVNIGDSTCAYNGTGKPKTSRQCFREYRPARVVDIKHVAPFNMGPLSAYIYTVAINAGRGGTINWNAQLDNLFVIHNPPPGKAKYFLLLNW